MDAICSSFAVGFIQARFKGWAAVNFGVVLKNARKHIGVKRKPVGIGFLGSCRDVAEEILSARG